LNAPASTTSAALAAWLAAGEVRMLEGRRIFTRVAETRSRPALLLLHGYPTSSHDWHAIWDALAARYSLYALDLLGFGRSEKPRRSSYAMTEQADLCQALLAAYGIRSVHVLAHDYSVTVAQELLARELEGRIALESVMFLNGGLFPETHRPRRIQKLLATPLVGPWLVHRMRYEHLVAALQSIWGTTPPREQDLRDMWQQIDHDGGRFALARLINYMAQRRQFRERWVGALVASQVPRALICGALDPVSGAHLAVRYRELVPEPDVTLLDDVGHYPQVEAPERVLEAYRRFRERLAC
jgi:pimeloyl-ACP methyl ester carboxylesterase